MLKIEKQKNELVEVYGKQFEIQLPTVRQIDDFQEKAKQPDYNDIKETLKFLNTLGVPQDITDDLNPDDFKALLEFVMHPKKK